MTMDITPSTPPELPQSIKNSDCSRTKIVLAWIRSVELALGPLSSSSPTPSPSPSAALPAASPSTQSPHKSRLAAKRRHILSQGTRSPLSALEQNTMEPRTSPRKSARLQKNRNKDEDRDEAAQHNDDVNKQGALNQTPRPRRGNAVSLSMVATRAPSQSSGSPQKSQAKPWPKTQQATALPDDPYIESIQGLGAPEAPSLASRPSTRMATSSSTSTSSRLQRRPRSPVKNMVHLRLTAKRIVHRRVSSELDLPTNVHTLFGCLKRAASGIGIVPADIEARVRSRLSINDSMLLPHNLYTNDNATPAVAARRPKTDQARRRELSIIVKATAATQQWMMEDASEVAWNARVHGPLLELATALPCSDNSDDDDDDVDTVLRLSQNAPVSFWDITVARPHRALLTRNSNGDALEAKMVDFCLALSDEDIQDRAVKTLQTELSSSDTSVIRSINHTEYTPLSYRPIAVNIETKASDGFAQEGRAQLAIWAVAHFERLRGLMRSRSGRDGIEDTELVVPIGLPMLLISGGTWMLLFAVDRFDCIEILETTSIADTKSILGCYQVVAAIRELAYWSETTFRQWLVDEVLVGGV